MTDWNVDNIQFDMLDALKAASVIIGHPDDAMSIHIKAVIERAENILFSKTAALPQADQWDEQLRGKKMSNTTGVTIFKYQMPVLERFTMKLPKGAQILRVDDQDGMFWMWAVIDTDAPDEERKFFSVKCGGKSPVGIATGEYIGFCKLYVQQELALYIFEEV
jgi:hypothetical protein